MKNAKTDKIKLDTRHFELIASILLACRSNAALKEFYDEDSPFWHKLNMHFAVRLLTTNDRFDMDLFLRASGSFSAKKELKPTRAPKKSNHFDITKPAQKRKEARKILKSLNAKTEKKEAIADINTRFIEHSWLDPLAIKKL